MVLFKGPLAGFSLTSSWNCGREESLRDPYVTSHSVLLSLCSLFFWVYPCNLLTLQEKRDGRQGWILRQGSD